MIDTQCMDIGFYRYSLLNRGGDRMVVEYANHLARKGHKVTFHLAEKNTVFSLHADIRISFVPWRGKSGFILYAATHNLAHDFLVVDIIHLCSLLSIRNRVVYFAQADDVEYYGGYLGRALIHILYRSFLRKWAKVITVDASLSAVFVARYGYTDSCTVTNGIDLAAFHHEPDQVLIDMKDDRKSVVFMARGDHYRKGYDVALEVFRSIDTITAQKIELWVCGSLMPENEFLFPVRNFGVVSDERLRQILSSADIFFYPSRHEGFGLFPLEAMACGCIPVTTEAVPYATKTDAILVSAVGDVSSLRVNIEKVINYQDDNVTLFKQKARRFAENYDLGKSGLLFEQTLLNMSGQI